MQPIKHARMYLPELDGLRFGAFFLVFIHHHPLFAQIPAFSFLSTFGWIGVDVFFVLSAFLFTKLLIAEYHKNEKIDLKKFYIRRIFRIYPLYFLFVLFWFLYTQDGGIRLIGLLTFTDNIMSAFFAVYNTFSYQNHLWTISYEEQFYLIVPFLIPALIRLSNKGKRLVLLSVFVVFTAIRVWFIANHIPPPAIWVLPITHFESITLGIVIGFGGLDFLLKKINPLLIGVIGVYLFIGLCILPNINTISYYLELSYTLVGLSTAFVLLAVLHSRFLQKVFSRKPLVFLGKRSYGLYVFHILGISLGDNYAHIIGTYTLLSSFILGILSTIILSVISYKLIETPFLRLKEKFEIVKTRPV